MKITKERILLTILFLIVLGIRLFFVFQQPNFSYDAYGELRQIEHIRETGVPLFVDDLSYSGRIQLNLPFFHYVLAGISFLIPLELTAKILPSIFFSLLTIIVYMITKHLSKNKVAAYTAAVFSGFVPIFFSTINEVSVSSLALLLIFCLSYSFVKIEEPGFDTLTLILTIMLLLTHATGLIFFLALIVYFFMMKIEKQKVTTKELEMSLFLFFLGLWFNVILFKKAFFTHGLAFIWSNLPITMLTQYFADINLIGVLYAVGIIPLLLGVVSIYHVLFKTKNKVATLYLAFTFTSAIMLWVKIVPFNEGLLLLSTNFITLNKRFDS